MATNLSRKLRGPERKSLLQILQNNFTYYDRNTYVHRLIYIGEINNKPIDTIKIIECFEKSIKPISEKYCDEPLTGFLLYLDNYFCHVVESSEESLVKHLQLLKAQHQIQEFFDKFKLLIVYHDANRRFVEEWIPINIFKKDTECSKSLDIADMTLDEITFRIKTVIRELYEIGNSLKSKVDESRSRMRASTRQRARSKSSSPTRPKINIDVDLLPATEDIKILINSPHTQPLKVYLNVFDTVPYFGEDNTWPVQKLDIPKHIFENPCNPIEDLPINNFDI